MEFGWLSVVWVVGALVLALGALRTRRLNARKAVAYGLGWTAIFLITALVFAEVGG